MTLGYGQYKTWSLGAIKWQRFLRDNTSKQLFGECKYNCHITCV